MKRIAVVVSVILAVCLVNAMSSDKILKESGVKGGLVVLLGCEDPEVAVELGAAPAFTVHILASDEKQVKAIRGLAESKGVYGKVSAELFSGKTLPYVDNLVNCIVVSGKWDVEREEILRVLAPRGIAIFTDGGEAQSKTANPKSKIIKPVPANIDEWTHFLRGADNNAVAQDTVVGPPRRLKWLADPLWLRSHETPSGIQAMVTGGGRIFYIFDEGLIGITDPRLPGRWSICARDAFNGKLLWKRHLEKWGWREWALDYWKDKDWTVVRAGRTKVPGQNQRRLVVDGDRIYATLSYNAPLSVLDAATGEVIKEIEETADTTAIFVHNGVVLALTSGEFKGLVAVDTQTYKVLWKTGYAIGDAGCTAVEDKVVAFVNGSLKAFDLHSGKELWSVKSPCKNLITLVAHPDVVVQMDRSNLVAFSTKEGKLLWKKKIKPRGMGDVKDLFIIDGLVWTGLVGVKKDGSVSGKSPDALGEGRNLKTGVVEKRIIAVNLRSTEHHHRCYRDKATSRYIISSMEGAEFFDTTDKEHLQQNWVRGACRYGMMPANGMLYVPPDQCFCSPGAKLLGLTALSPGTNAPAFKGNRLQRGPAFGEVSVYDEPSVTGWPVFRKDFKRSGFVKTSVSTNLSKRWSITLKGKLTAPVAADGRVYTACKDNNTVYALNMKDGKVLWHFTAGGEVDSPPGILGGNVIFGSRDGRIYCLRTDDGVLAWSFLAARNERRVMAFDRLESIWPVNGSVLLYNGLVYAAAGRSSYLDGGIDLYALNPVNGEIVHKSNVYGPDYKQGGRGLSFFSEGVNADVLVAEGGHIFMRQKMFTPELKEAEIKMLTPKGEYDIGRHLFSTAGLLDDSWYNRTFWMYSKRWPGFQLANQSSKSGQLLVFDEKRTYGVRVFYHRNVHSPMFFPGTEGYLLFADSNDNEPQIVGEEGARPPVAWLPQSDYSRGRNKKGKGSIEKLGDPAFGRDKMIGYTRAEPPLWKTWLKLRIRAMVKADDTLFVAGPPDICDEKDPFAAFEGRAGALLCAVAAKDGTQLSEIKLDSPPVFDGLIAADGNLFMCALDGTVTCFE